MPRAVARRAGGTLTATRLFMLGSATPSPKPTMARAASTAGSVKPIAATYARCNKVSMLTNPSAAIVHGADGHVLEHRVVMRRTLALNATGSRTEQSENQAMPHAMTILPAAFAKVNEVGTATKTRQEERVCVLTAMFVGERPAQDGRDHVAPEKSRLYKSLRVRSVAS